MSRNSILSDAIKQNISILDYAQQQLGYTPERVGNQYALKEHDSVRINVEKNIFYRHSTARGGSIIDFVMEFEGLSQGEAIRKLRGCLAPGSRARAPAHTTFSNPKQEKKVELPEAHNGRFSRVFAYLTKSRGIDNEIVAAMIKRKALYEDKRHNCVFVGYNEKNEAAFGCLRGTNTQTDKPFRGDCTDSDKAIGWYIGHNSKSLVVVEAPIDAMSFMTMLKLHGKDYRQYDYLAIGGMCNESLPYHFGRLPRGQIQTVFLAVDNDKKGVMARTAYRNQLQKLGYTGRVLDKIPLSKDWNDDLNSLKKSRDKKKEQSKSKQKERGISYEQGA